MRSVSLIVVNFLAVSVLLLTLAADAAQKKNVKKASTIKAPIKTSLIVDASSGKILHAENAKEKIFPASITKNMTTYLIFKELAAGRLKLTDKFKVSKYFLLYFVLRASK